MKFANVGISFAGGGLKSFAHVSLVQDLEQHEVPIVAVAGTSMGSVLASLYACGLDGHQLEKKLIEIEEEFKKRKIMSKPTVKILPVFKDRSDGLIEQSSFHSFVKEMFDNMGITMISEVPLPLCIVATDLITGDIILFTNNKEYFRKFGSDCQFYEKDVELATAVSASCAFPLVFQSVALDDLRMVDGGVRLNSPGALFKRDKVAKVVAITSMGGDNQSVDYSLRDVAYRSLTILMSQLERLTLMESDLHVNFPIPTNLMFDVGKGQHIITQAKEFLKNHPVDYAVLYQPNTWKNLWGLL